jgi:hypothetical protein
MNSAVFTIILSFMNNKQKPNLDKGLFWDWRYDEIDWQKTYRSIIERVLERGTSEEWDEITRFYGKPKIITALKEEIKFLPDYIIDRVSSYFNIRKEEMACYKRKQLRKGQWI